MKQIVEAVMQELMAQRSNASACTEGMDKLLVIGDLQAVPADMAEKYQIFLIDDYIQNKNIHRYQKILITSLTLVQMSDIAQGRDGSPEACAVINGLLNGLDVCMTEAAFPHRKYAGKSSTSGGYNSGYTDNSSTTGSYNSTYTDNRSNNTYKTGSSSPNGSYTGSNSGYNYNPGSSSDGNGDIPGRGAATASLVLGIISIVCWVFTATSFIGLITGIIGLICSSSAKKAGFKGGIQTAGFVCSLIGVIGGAIVLVACVACVGILGTMGAIGEL